jgi:inhibitor of the pro-sigma K processing machinery
MILPQYNTIFAYILGIVLIFIAIKLFTAPLRLLLKIVVNGAMGLAGLIVINLVGAGFGFSVAINLVTVLIAGFLGLPGIALLLFLRWIGL